MTSGVFRFAAVKVLRQGVLRVLFGAPFGEVFLLLFDSEQTLEQKSLIEGSQVLCGGLVGSLILYQE